jgi:hypothetical protein
MLRQTWVILFLLAVIVLVNVLWRPVVQEGVDSNINYYTFARLNKKSASNVQNQKSKIGRRLNVIQYMSPKPNSRIDFFQQLMQLKNIRRKMEDDSAKFLSVFLEDGFAIQEPGLNSKLESIVHDLGEKEYDFLLLGGNPNMQGEMVKEGVYRINPDMPFTNVGGYVINNMNLDKTMSKIKKKQGKSLLGEISRMARNRDISVFCLYPFLVTGL